MEALMASYGDSSSDSDTEHDKQTTNTSRNNATTCISQSETITPPLDLPLPPPPLALLNPSTSLGCLGYHLPSGQPSRVRSFPHVEGNYALHVYIPVLIPSAPKKELAQFLKKVSSVLPGLHVVDVDIPFHSLCKDDSKLEQVALGREFHISLGRTVPIRVHQIDSIVAMLHQKLQSQRQLDFSLCYDHFGTSFILMIFLTRRIWCK